MGEVIKLADHRQSEDLSNSDKIPPTVQSQSKGVRKALKYTGLTLAIGAGYLLAGALWATNIKIITERLSPHKVYEVDLNGDGLRDLVIQNAYGSPTIYMRESEDPLKKSDITVEQQKTIDALLVN